MLRPLKSQEIRGLLLGLLPTDCPETSEKHMANSRFGYVRDYELSDALLPGTFLVVRLDGKGFHRFADQHAFEKPNDRRALDLINAAAMRTMESETLRQHVLLAFGESDEYSFLLAKTSTLFNRRERCVWPDSVASGLPNTHHSF